MRLFSGVTLTPLVLLGAGLWLGAAAAYALPIYMAVVIWAFDRFVERAAPHVPQAEEFPAGDGLSVVLALGHLLALPLVVWALAGGVMLSLPQGLALGAGFALWLGQVSNSNAHELIHRSDRWLRGLGTAVFVSVGYGHHVSAHRLVHHRHVATPEDPNTARRGEGFYRYLWRAVRGEFREGLRAERDLVRRKAGRRNPYVIYGVGTGLAVTVAAALAGWRGVGVWMALAIYAQLQLYLSDYVQHYGLERRRLANGRYEPVWGGHSWDARHWASSALMLNAPRHSDHHAHPARSYVGLELPESGLRLPRSLPVMAVLALVPPVWFRVMDRRLPPQAGDGPAGGH